MTKLANLARLIRSKNAGPFELTFDIMFEDDATYQRVKNSGALTREEVAKRYNLPVSEVKFPLNQSMARVMSLYSLWAQ